MTNTAREIIEKHLGGENLEERDYSKYNSRDAKRIREIAGELQRLSNDLGGEAAEYIELAIDDLRDALGAVM